MLFIHPMWDTESQRIGMKKCWALAYNIHGIGELIGFMGLLAIVSFVIYLPIIWILKGLDNVHWWLLVTPFAMGILSEIMVQVSWAMVKAKKFNYSYENRESSWLERGELIKYKFVK